MSKVTCKTCKSEDNGYCTKKKNIKIKLNKRRRCELYVDDTSKYKISTDIEAVYVPYSDRKKIRKQEHTKMDMNAIANNKHPLTGNLSERFRTTSGDR